MGKEINLLSNYPKSKRDSTYRAKNKNENVRTIARKFEENFLMALEIMVMEVLIIIRRFWTSSKQRVQDFL